MAEIAQLYLKDRPQHDKLAKEWTNKYAISSVQKKSAGSSNSNGKGNIEVIVIDDD